MASNTVLAQESKSLPWEKTQVYASIGLSIPILHGGEELMRSQSLRENSKSYFLDNDGKRDEVGNYSPLIGWAIKTGFYKPTSFAKRLMLGASVTASLTGTSPSARGTKEAYYFNSVLLGIAWKYYPVKTSNIALKGELGLSSVFTKDRFIANNGEQKYHHQFGIGSGGTAGIAWEFNQKISFDLTHSFMVTRVEVNSIGNDSWSFGTTNLMLKYNF